MHDLSTAPRQRWYQGLDRYCWIVLAIAGLGWMFDTMDQNLFTLVRGPSMKSLLSPHISDPKALDMAVSAKGGLVTSIFLIGWSLGGFIFGMLGDRLGRTRTMMLTILIYSLFTGLSGLVHSWQMSAFTRFMTALGVGGEWAAGAALVAESFPQRSRSMALGFLQSISAVGNMTAALIALSLGNLVENWRYVYFVGALPAILVVFIARSVKEPASWLEARQRAKEAAASGQDRSEFGSIAALFRDPLLRGNTIAAMLMATAGVGALWGVGFYSPEMTRGELVRAGLNKAAIDQRATIVFLVQQVGSLLGTICFATIAERFNRRKAFALFFVLAWSSVLAFFWGVAGSGASAFKIAAPLAMVMGFCTLGPFAGYTLYFPELFPTRLRSTGCGFCYNAARVLAAIAPFALGKLNVSLGGYAPAASVVSCIYILGFIGTAMGPETRGKGLPDELPATR